MTRQESNDKIRASNTLPNDKSKVPTTICKYGDPLCPCPDGDKCHYEGADGWLLPCPFCGGDAKMHHRDEDDADFIECKKCGASTNLQYSVKDDGRPGLVERWNSRFSSAGENIGEKNE